MRSRLASRALLTATALLAGAGCSRSRLIDALSDANTTPPPSEDVAPPAPTQQPPSAPQTPAAGRPAPPPPPPMQPVTQRDPPVLQPEPPDAGMPLTADDVKALNPGGDLPDCTVSI